MTQCTPTREWKESWETRQGKWEQEMMQTRGHPREGSESQPHDEL